MKWVKSIGKLGLDKYLEDKIPLFRSAKTIQILVLRQTHDYAIFRTEETRELNTVTLPRSIDDPEPVMKVVFMASKQKAPESRNFISLFRTYAAKNGVSLSDAVLGCSLKDSLCRTCPRCALFGAVTTEGRRGGGAERWNIKHRIEYSSAYSIELYEDVMEMITFNAVDTATMSTGRALGYTENVEPIVHFPSVVTLVSATEEELIWYLKTLMATKSYGAETRVKGDVVNEVIGIVAGMEEVITSLELSLELAKKGIEDPYKAAYEAALKYAEDAAFKSDVLVLNPNDLRGFIEEIRRFEPNKEFVESMYEKSRAFADKVNKRAEEIG